MATKKVKIPATLRNSIWNYYIGSDLKSGICFCCNTEAISTANFECGHIKSEKYGGELTIDNLRPVCSLCNKSMGTQNMEIFMKKYGFIKNKYWTGIKRKIADSSAIKSKLKRKEKDFYDTLNSKELKIIGKELDIKEKSKTKIIESIMSIDFCYDEWFSKYIDQITINKLKIICKFLKLNVKKNKQKTKEMLKDENIQIFMINEIMDDNKDKKYFVECCGDKNKSCIHCKFLKDGSLLQCDKCCDSHVYFTNDNISKDAEDIITHSEYYWIKAKCSKCNTKTTQLIYNNPFFNFVNKTDKLIFDDTQETTKTNESENKDFAEYERAKKYITEMDDIDKLKTEVRELKKQLAVKEALLRHGKFTIVEKLMKLEFDDPSNRCFGEKKSKLLLVGSDLFNYLSKLKNTLRHNGFVHQDRMGLHVEILNDDTEGVDEFIKRVKSLEGKIINVSDPNNYSIEGQAIVLMLGKLEGYHKNAKINIMFVDDNENIDNAFICLLNNI